MTDPTRCAHRLSLAVPCREQAVTVREAPKKDGNETRVPLCSHHAGLHDVMSGGSNAR